MLNAKRLWMAYNHRIVEIYVAIHTPVIPRSFNVIRCREYISQTKADERLNDGLFKGVDEEEALQYRGYFL